MPGAERILQLTDMLRGRDTSTVKDLAAALGVSRRTLPRDLASLRERGMPIDGEAGPECDLPVIAVTLQFTYR